MFTLKNSCTHSWLNTTHKPNFYSSIHSWWQIKTMTMRTSMAYRKKTRKFSTANKTCFCCARKFITKRLVAAIRDLRTSSSFRQLNKAAIQRRLSVYLAVLVHPESTTSVRRLLFLWCQRHEDHMRATNPRKKRRTFKDTDHHKEALS